MEITSRTVQVAVIKIFENEIPSILLVEEKGDNTANGKPPGWAIPGGGQGSGENEIEAGWREWVGETKRWIDFRRFSELVAFRWSALKPSRNQRDALHEDVLLLVFVADEVAKKEIKPAPDDIFEASEIKRVAWFRFNALPRAATLSRGQIIQNQLSMYHSHRQKLASALRKLADTNPQIFEKFGLEPETLARMVEPKTR